MHGRFIAAGAALLLGVSAGAPDAVAGPGAKQGSAASRQREELQGRIARVDEAQREIVLDAGDATTQVRVAKDAKITIDGASAKLGDLKRGAEVRASLDRAGGDPQVVRIEAVGKHK